MTGWPTRIISVFVALIHLVFPATNGWAEEKSLEEIRESAEAGDADMQFNLGRKYYLGEGVPQDYAQAAKWYTKAAEQGYSKAQFNLGVMYEAGQGVPQDYAQAVKWFTKAAEQGEVNAQLNLGGMYYSGRGVPQDYVRAHLWWDLAANRATGTERDKAVKYRDHVAAKMTPKQIAEAKRLAKKWKPKKPAK